MKLDQVYVINLNTPEDEIIKKIQEVNWNEEIEYYVYPAVDGWDLNKSNNVPNFRIADWWKIDSENSFHNREVKPGEMGCTLSHLKIIKEAFEEGYKNILILEEDFVYKGKFPTIKELKLIPNEASMVYLDRNQLWGNDREERINKYITKVGYTYNNHAYIVTRKGMEEILNSSILDNVIAIDEFLPAINGTSDRGDAVKTFHNPNFEAYSLNGGYFSQSSITETNALTEFPPEYVNNLGKTGNKTFFNNKHIELNILNDTNWEEYCKKYINPFIVRQEWDVLITEPIPHVYSWNMFTEEFCKELIELGEQFDWTQKRHEFYPTTDNLLKVLGMDKVYNRILNDFVKPLATHLYGLEGSKWDHLNDESFIIKYPHNQQSHLDLHHDNSNITTLLNLNPGEFEGGGTYFQKWKSTINPKQIGTMTLHPGNITHKHGAQPVLKGTRYVVVSFITSN
tara:strand:+ start:70 stop:1431 length:1362 start_codon:yes stop_codon:yes gene_type:complete